MDLAGIEPGAL